MPETPVFLPFAPLHHENLSGRVANAQKSKLKRRPMPVFFSAVLPFWLARVDWRKQKPRFFAAFLITLAARIYSCFKDGSITLSEYNPI